MQTLFNAMLEKHLDGSDLDTLTGRAVAHVVAQRPADSAYKDKLCLSVVVRLEKALLEAALDGNLDADNPVSEERALVAIQANGVGEFLGGMTSADITDSTFFVDAAGTVTQVYVASRTPGGREGRGEIALDYRKFPPHARHVGKSARIEGYELLGAIGYAS